MSVLRVSHPNTSEAGDADLATPARAPVGGSQYGDGSAALTIAVVVFEDRHDVDKISIAECDDLVTDRLVILTWIKDRSGGLPTRPAVGGAREPCRTAERRSV